MTVYNRVRWLALLVFLLRAAVAYADDFKTHYDLALALYQAQRFDDAIPEFKAAYELSAKPGLLFNLAQAYRKAGHPREAIDYYDRYLSSAPQLDNDTRHKVDGYLAEARNTLASLELEMKQRLAEEKAAHDQEPVPTPATPPPPAGLVAVSTVSVHPGPSERPVYKRWWFWTLLGGTVVAGVAIGVGVGLSANNGPSLPANAAGARGTLFF